MDCSGMSLEGLSPPNGKAATVKYKFENDLRRRKAGLASAAWLPKFNTFKTAKGFVELHSLAVSHTWTLSIRLNYWKYLGTKIRWLVITSKRGKWKETYMKRRILRRLVKTTKENIHRNYYAWFWARGLVCNFRIPKEPSSWEEPLHPDPAYRKSQATYPLDARPHSQAWHHNSSLHAQASAWVRMPWSIARDRSASHGRNQASQHQWSPSQIAFQDHLVLWVWRNVRGQIWVRPGRCYHSDRHYPVRYRRLCREEPLCRRRRYGR